ncbi:MAG TPA: methyl-accepting chemotaxis protein [Steroidobacteraceae bacterium]|nr:methyl-accepting chemotaxis protein [Steroidobacteraceae bacterium]HYB65555.1 methyl-accepting chemotaxis protein [Steroidobacteraceae bacterium]
MSDAAGLGRVPAALAALLVLAAPLLIGSAVVSYLAQTRVGGAARTAPADALLGLAVDAPSAAQGDPHALARLQQSQKQLDDAAARAPEAFAGDGRFTRLMNNASAVLSARNQLTDIGNAGRDTQSLVPKLVTEAEALEAALPPQGAAAGTLERFQSRAEQLALAMSALVQGTADPLKSAARIGEDNDSLGQVLAGFAGGNSFLGLPRVSGSDAEGHLKTLNSLHAELSAAVKRTLAAVPALPAAQSAARAIPADARALAARAPGSAAEAGLMAWLPLILLGAGIVFLLAALTIALRLRRTADRQRRSADEQRKESDRNQQAILRLLDELSSLADGDLTVQATVTEDITGAIADSINYAVEALRGLVTTINGSAIQLDSATRQTQALSQHLAKASGAQSKQIASATENAASMASSVEEVSGNAERAADVARHSVEVAHKGGDAVRRTIDGMNAIRETIQETSKRIKRLGESSQEIGNIVELINDIAEQTNILALNASIQSSMAGEAGRGFAVVADEVQRLAERAATATKQIEVLVRTIQTDTNEAVVSMERSTTDVVGGALLAENAGAALEEIEQVSNQIASLVQNIFASARQQTSAAQTIARNMGVLKDISAQTAESTQATSIAIAKLAELSAGLRRSASGFRLPGSPAPERAGSSGLVKRLEDTPLSTAKVRQISALGGS